MRINGWYVGKAKALAGATARPCSSVVAMHGSSGSTPFTPSLDDGIERPRARGGTTG